MKKIMSILAIVATTILVLSGVGIAVVNNNELTVVNHPPDKPWITGPLQGKIGVEYAFKFNAVDPDGDNVSYYVDWGDGTNSGWTNYYGSGEDVIISHTWNKIDHNTLRCKAKDIYGAEGNWSDCPIEISKNKAFNFNLNLLEWLFNRIHLAFPKR